jgi:hypothetical protein
VSPPTPRPDRRAPRPARRPARRRPRDDHDPEGRREGRPPPRRRASGSKRSADRTAVVVGGNRIPFARSNGAYARASNQDMLTAALDGLVARFGLAGQRLDEVVGGAVLKHSRDFNLVRESVLGTALDPATPAFDIQRACDTSLEAPCGGQQDPPGPGRGRHRLRHGHDLRRPDRPQRRPAPGPDGGQPRQGAAGLRQAAGPAAARPDRPGDPSQRRTSHRHGHGRPPGHHHRRVGHQPRGTGRAGHPEPRQPGGGLRPRVHGRPGHPVPGAEPRRQPAAGLDPGEAGEAEARVR